MGTSTENTAMSLITYLNKYFTAGASGVFESETVSIVPHFFDKFGVDVKNEGNLYVFKYDMLAAKFSLPITSECRGSVFRFGDGKWTQCSRPWKKFFNLSEGFCPFFNVKEFAKNNSLSLVSKEDGTAIQVYHDGNDWRVSTLGTITPSKVGDYNITFDKLFKITVRCGWDALVKDLIVGNTYMFELCTEENRIVTKYASNRVYLLSVIDAHGVYFDDHAITCLAEKWNVLLPRRVMLYEYDIATKDQLVEWVEKNCPDSDEKQFSEGFVLYDGQTPVAKIKTANYLALHHVGGGDTAHSKNVLIDAFFAGSVDDIEKVLNKHLTDFLAKLREWYAAKRAFIFNEVVEIAKSEYPTQKDFALRVQKIDDKRLASFFFANKEKVIAGAVDGDDIARFFKLGWSKFEKDIKELA
jgi:hypothetical protein